MDELLYQALNDYFKALGILGYKSYNTVYKLMVMSFIYDITNTELRYYINNNDIKLMQDVLYQFIGSTCEISFPTNNRPCCYCINPIQIEQPSVSISIAPSNSITLYENDTKAAEVDNINVTTNKDGHIKITQGNTTVYDGDIVKGSSTITLTTPFIQSVSGLAIGSYKYPFNAIFTSGEQSATASDTLTVNISKPVDTVYYKVTDTEFSSIDDSINTTESKFTIKVPTSKWWIAIPSSKSIIIENADFKGDWYYNPDNGYNSKFLTKSNITVENKDYTVYQFSHYLPLDMNLEITIK